MRSTLSTIAVALALALTCIAQASALPKTANIERNAITTIGFGKGKVLACDDPKVVPVIMSKFKTLAREVHHDPDLAIAEIDDLHQHRFLGASEDFPIARRYCGGTVHLNDGRHRTLWFLIEDQTGFAGFFGDGITFCVSGFDRWNAHNAACRVLR